MKFQKSEEIKVSGVVNTSLAESGGNLALKIAEEIPNFSALKC